MVHTSTPGQAQPGRSGAQVGVRTADRFRQAVEAGDAEAIRGLLAEDVTLHGPVVAEPVHGARDAGAVLWAALSRFEDVRYVGQLGGRTGPRLGVETHVLRFRAQVRGRQIEGIDVLELDGDGLIATLTVLFRPLDALAGTGFVHRRGSRR